MDTNKSYICGVEGCDYEGDSLQAYHAHVMGTANNNPEGPHSYIDWKKNMVVREWEPKQLPEDEPKELAQSVENKQNEVKQETMVRDKDETPIEPSDPKIPEKEPEPDDSYPDCPQCDTDLVSVNEVDPQRIEYRDSEYACLNCGGEYKGQ